jgi:hypothetical protein
VTSTYLSYRVLVKDLPRTLRQTAARAEVSREAEYYRANIGKVKTVDEFLKDQRLYSYAMRAHGLSDMIYAKAFMRKVLTSDLSDTKSFARGLTDTRFQDFARILNFTAKGAVVADVEVAQTDIQLDDTSGLYTEHRVRSGERAATEVANYQDRLGLLDTVDKFLRDERIFNFVLTAYGLDPSIASTTTIRDVLTSDLSDPQSRANTLGGKYLALASAFGYGTDGTLPAGTDPQSEAQINETILRYYEVTGNGKSPAAAAFKTELYRDAIAAVASVDDLLASPTLFEYALTAFGLDPTTETTSNIRLVLTSDLSDPSSYANSLSDTRYRTLAAAFNFATDGTISGSDGAQSTAQIEDTVDLYFTHYDDSAENQDALDTTYFRNRIGKIASVDDLMADSKLYDYLLESYGLDPAVESRVTIRKVLLSDVDDKKSYANTLSDERYRKLAAAVNFDADGTVARPHKAQTDYDELATIRLYNTRLGPSPTSAEQKAAKTENEYFHATLATLRSVDDLLADKRLVAYIVKAFGLEDENPTKDTLRKALTSDPTDKNSFAAKLNDSRYRDLAASFNFTADGKLGRIPAQTAQLRSAQLQTAELYLLQTMETDAGNNQSDGVRLALYFRRKAANIDSAFDILADKALIEVTKTALNLPGGFSQMDVDAQAKLIAKRVNFADFQDSAKLDKFLARFSSLYDIANSTSSTSSAASILFGGSSDIGFSQSLIQSLQGLRVGRS